MTKLTIPELEKFANVTKLRKDVFQITENDKHKSTLSLTWDPKLQLFKVPITGFWYAIETVEQLIEFYHGLTQKELELK